MIGRSKQIDNLRYNNLLENSQGNDSYHVSTFVADSKTHLRYINH